MKGKTPLTGLISIIILLPFPGEPFGKGVEETTTRYRVDVTFDSTHSRMVGEVIIHYHNRSGMNLKKIPMFLRNDDREENLIEHCSVNGMSADVEYRYPTNGESFTGIEVLLPEPIPTGATCAIHISFKSGKGSNFYGYTHFCHRWNDITDWLPTVLVMENGKIYPSRQALSDYDVTLKCPTTFKCASSGLVLSEKPTGDTKTIHMKAEDVPDFGILLSEDFIVEEAEAAGVKIRSFYFKEEKKWGKFLLEKAQDIVPFYKDTIGFYPQPIISILPGGPDPWGGYPVCANCVVVHGGLDKKGDGAEEFANWILAHEIGHEYFGFGHILEDYDYPQWFGLSMGIYTDYLYNSARGITRSGYHTRRNYYMAGVLAGLNTTILRKISDLDREGFDWNNVIAHSKSSTVLTLLQQLVGEKTFWTIYKTYLEKHKGKTVTLESFKNTCESISGMELDWFFHQWYETPDFLDYRVVSTKTWRAGDTFITECKIVRKGDAVMPLTVGLETSDGHLLTKDIDGWFKEKTLTFRTETGPARVIIDPEKKLPFLEQAEQSITSYGMGCNQLERMGKYDEALRLYQNARHIGREDPVYWYHFGLCYRIVGDYASAIDTFEKIDDCKKHEDYPRYKEYSILELGKTYDLMGKREEAEKHYRESLKSERTKEEAEKYLKTPYQKLK